MREEEKAATFPLRFTCLEHLISVELGTQTVFDHLKINLVNLPQEPEAVGGVFGDTHVFIDDKVCVLWAI